MVIIRVKMALDGDKRLISCKIPQPSFATSSALIPSIILLNFLNIFKKPNLLLL